MSSKKRAKVDRRKQRLWIAQNGRCYWCECYMLHWNDLRSDPAKVAAHGIKRVGGKESIKVPPLRLATIDHLRDRFDPTRWQRPINKEQRWVLACSRCNHKRGIARQKEQPIEVLHEHAQRHRLAIASATHLQAAE